MGEKDTWFDNFCRQWDVIVRITYLKEVMNKGNKLVEWEHDVWDVVVKRRRDGMQDDFIGFQYRTGLGHRKLGIRDEKDLKNLVSTAIGRENFIRRNARPVMPERSVVMIALLEDAGYYSNYTSLEEHCACLGVSDDSIKALMTYNACKEKHQQLVRMFSDKLLRELKENLLDEE